MSLVPPRAHGNRSRQGLPTRSSSAPDALSLPPRKPMRRSRRIPLFEREVQLRLSPAAVDLLWHHAAVLSEGETTDGIYCGSTMITLDLARAAAQLSETCDQTTAETLERLIIADPHVQRRACRLAREQATERAGRPLTDVSHDLAITRVGRHFNIDIDIEGILTEGS